MYKMWGLEQRFLLTFMRYLAKIFMSSTNSFFTAALAGAFSIKVYCKSPHGRLDEAFVLDTRNASK